MFFRRYFRVESALSQLIDFLLNLNLVHLLFQHIFLQSVYLVSVEEFIMESRLENIHVLGFLNYFTSMVVYHYLIYLYSLRILLLLLNTF